MPPHIGPQGVQSAMNISAREASETRKVDDFITRFICKLMQPLLVNVLMNVKRIKNKVFICFKKKFFFISQNPKKFNCQSFSCPVGTPEVIYLF